jgi:HlyD family type I secretion membrane fusion protein
MSNIQLNTGTPPLPPDWSADVKTDASDVAGLGAKIGLFALAAFIAWGTLVPIDSAVHAPGSVIAQGRNKLLQHKTGGTVRKIHAVEGQVIKKGDPIVELDPAVDQAQLSQYKARYARLAAIKARLSAEKAGGNGKIKSQNDSVEEIEASLETTGSSDATNSDPMFVEQQREFTKGRDAIAAEVAALEERVDGNRRQRKGLQSREVLLREQVALLSKQRASLQRLVNADHVPKQRLWEVEGQLLDRRNELDRIQTEKEALANAIAEIQSTITNVKSKDQRVTSEKMTEILSGLDELKDQIVAAESLLKDTVVRAPVDGRIFNMRLVTEGGVVTPGDAFAEIVPEGAAVELLARVRPEDVAYVHVGQEAEMRITALNARIFDKVPGEVVYVAADATEDRRTGERYFEVRGRLKSEEMSKQSGVAITPGMNGEVFLKGKKRSFLAYLLQPITDGISTAFKEPH